MSENNLSYHGGPEDHTPKPPGVRAQPLLACFPLLEIGERGGRERPFWPFPAWVPPRAALSRRRDLLAPAEVGRDEDPYTQSRA
ncbi:hypothetical protein PCASD_16841 [Puccinia coronata f. sp. avenae]|uniref:Uncharacterized protein n=1 Tax=Puccinia coronata f. sp. avenae TaxID=200324 RepID=A0A2N5U4K2_9BASI|nr:hypothetical protein PCASD_16841 [Puccinia coronata f. sp. avenae]